MKLKYLVAVTALWPLAAFAQTPEATITPTPKPAVKKINPSKIILVGDSTTAVIGGWGPSFCGYHVSSFANCVNLARGGRSSRTYIAEGSWDIALNEMRTPGYSKVWVLIQFGHNDQPGTDRTTNLETEFPDYIRQYVREARAAGAIPVLVTPLTRRAFDGPKHVNSLAPWAEAVRRIATEMQVPVIDLNADSARAVQAMGQEAADRFAQLPRGAEPTGKIQPQKKAGEPLPTVVPKLSFDDTHLGREGADYFADMVARELAAAVPDMRPLLVVTP
ncbi:rhamnogalacturonan acetylesterase [Asticcacaulis sp. BYS171W]|uniref:Rhamnogalacturonan acetylesterase n=1 Tax=Asticcacaulis aquaticus TaxID=2984212 RepID=A0ABT5HX66_9CAUL|nr:rhamnogalacturonan acetylesterase [Asticcacaulis aquaticus]MDC7684671.1 rhamnogalacturonan acetylesterase [Asticcacaulis aquaticus]